MVSDGLNEGVVVGGTSEAGGTSADSADASSRPFVGGEGEGRSGRQANSSRWPSYASGRTKDLLALQLGERASNLISRDREMVRLGCATVLRSYPAEGVT